jgi:hypothetical protein
VRVAARYDVHRGGDHVNGPSPVETLERLRGLGDRAVCLRGNCDRELSEPGMGPTSLEVLDWVRERLTAADAAFLLDLPAAVELRVEGLDDVLVCHEDEPGACSSLLGPGLESLRTAFEPAALWPTGFPRPWPTPGRAEATALLEADAIGA